MGDRHLREASPARLTAPLSNRWTSVAAKWRADSASAWVVTTGGDGSGFPWRSFWERLSRLFWNS